MRAKSLSFVFAVLWRSLSRRINLRNTGFYCLPSLWLNATIQNDAGPHEGAAFMFWQFVQFMFMRFDLISVYLTAERFCLFPQYRYMKYLYPYECDRLKLSTPVELQSAIDGNRREGRRSTYTQFDTHMQNQLGLVR